jgi:hypothetical protein
MKNYILILIVSIITFDSYSQGTTYAKIFSDFNYSLADVSNPYKEFKVSNAIFGHKHTLNNKFSANITFDVGNNSSGSSYTAFLKLASLKWSPTDRVFVDFGIIKASNFTFMENSWGKRYIYKSFQDVNKWSHFSDAGVGLTYILSDNLIIDAQILNGDGYKNLQGSDAYMRGGAGIIFKADDISFRVARDVMPRTMYSDDYESQYINTLAVAYSGSNMTLGGEYNLRENTSNVVDNTSSAFSVYGNLDIGNDVSVFGRYDMSDSEDANENQWNIENEGELTIIGIEKQMTKGVKVAVNVKSFKAATLDGEEEAEANNMLYLNLEYKF